MNNKVIILGPGKQTRGGITSVIKAHKQTETWKKWNCIWIETYIDRSSFFKILYFIKGLFKFLIYIPNTSIVHIHFSESTSAIRKYIYLKIAKFFNKPVILHFHSFSPETTLFGSKRKLYKKMFQKADVIIALSGFWKIQISKVITNPEKIKIIYNPCPSIQLPVINDKHKTILFAGTLNKRKGYVDLIKAFSNIAHMYNDWKLILAGNGEIEKGRTLAEKLDISNQVIFKGWISGKEKEKLFQQTSIFCLPSYAEGFPMAVLDAWAYGIPVVTTPVGGLPDILEHGKNAMVFEPGDIDELAKNLKELISNKKLRNKLSKKSLLLSQNEFNIKTISVQLDEIYNQLIN